MKPFFVSSFLIFLLPLSALSDTPGFHGIWSGPGSASIVNGKTRKCSKIFIEWQENADKLVLNEGGYLCEDMNAAFDRAEFARKGKDLFWENKRIGTISEEKIFLALELPEEDLHYELELTKTGNTLRFEEHWKENGKPVFHVNGELVRK